MIGQPDYSVLYPRSTAIYFRRLISLVDISPFFSALLGIKPPCSVLRNMPVWMVMQYQYNFWHAKQVTDF